MQAGLLCEIRNIKFSINSIFHSTLKISAQTQHSKSYSRINFSSTWLHTRNYTIGKNIFFLTQVCVHMSKFPCESLTLLSFLSESLPGREWSTLPAPSPSKAAADTVPLTGQLCHQLFYLLLSLSGWDLALSVLIVC